MPQEQWEQLQLQDATDDPLARLHAERDNTRRNIAGWRAQIERIRRSGHEPPAGLVASITAAEGEVRRLDSEILRVQRASYDEGQRSARQRIADQAVRVGKALPDKGEE
jgi:hypothetical protein